MAVERGFKIASAFVEITADYDSFRRSIETDLPKKIGPAADRAGQNVGKRLTEGVRKKAVPESERVGRDSGGKLAQGMHLSIVRNSPLIAAAIGGALAAGAPLLLASAGALFAGIGIVAAAQSTKVQRAWRGTFEYISLAARQDASVIEDTLTRAAGRVAEGFDRLRPSLREAFAGAAPLIDKTVDGILDLAENAMPGLLRAISNGGPVFDGLQSFLGSVGTGLSDFFSILSEHAPAAGKAFAAIGDILAELLPILGQLLGHGAELAAIVLPPLAKALGVVADVLDTLGPLLPAISAGFLGMKVASAAAGWVGSFGDKLKELPSKMTATNAALGVMGAVIGLTIAAMQESDAQTRAWADALNEGGSAAETAKQQMSDYAAIIEQQSSGLTGFGQQLMGTAGFLSIYSDDVEEAVQAHKDWWESLSPLEQANAKVAEWTKTLSERLNDESASTADVEAAKRRLAYWQDTAAQAARDEAEAVHGSSIAMQDAVDAANALIDALDKMNGPALSLRDAQRGFQQAIDDVTASIEENGRTLDINTQAGRDNADALDNMASSAADMAEWVYKTTGSYDDFRANLEGSRQDLYEQARAFNMTEEGAWNYVNSVLAIPDEATVTAEFDATSAQTQVDGLIAKMKEAEEGATINLGVISEDAFNILDQMGIKVHALPDGTVEVTIDQDVTDVLDNDVVPALNDVAGMRPTPVLDADGRPLAATVTTGLDQLGFLGSQRPIPIASLNGIPLLGGVNAALANVGTLGRQRPTPIASLLDYASGGLRNVLGLINSIPESRWTTVTTVMRTVYETVGSIPLFHATGGKIGRADGGKIGFDGGGEVHGPGGPTDDLVRVLGPDPNIDYRLSNLEWVIRASSAMRYGDEKMQAVNNGTAEIIVPTRGFAGGGSPGETFGSGSGGGVRIERVEVNLRGMFDFRDRRGMRQFAEALRAEIEEIEREYR